MATVRGWDDCEKRAKETAGGNSMFLKLEDGDKVIVAFRGAPVARDVVWMGPEKGYQDFDKSKHDETDCKTRFKTNVFVLSDGTVKIWEMPGGAFQSVLKARNKYGLDDNAFEVSRDKGSNGIVGYDVLFERKLTPDERKAVDGAKVHNLEKNKYSDDSDDLAFPGEDVATDDDGPVDEKTKSVLIGRLKQLPKSALSEWLKRVGVGKVGDLKQREIGKAFADLEALEKVSDPVEADPFA